MFRRKKKFDGIHQMLSCFDRVFIIKIDTIHVIYFMNNIQLEKVQLQILVLVWVFMLRNVIKITQTAKLAKILRLYRVVVTSIVILLKNVTCQNVSCWSHIGHRKRVTLVRQYGWKGRRETYLHSMYDLEWPYIISIDMD